MKLNELYHKQFCNHAENLLYELLSNILQINCPTPVGCTKISPFTCCVISLAQYIKIAWPGHTQNTWLNGEMTINKTKSIHPFVYCKISNGTKNMCFAHDARFQTVFVIQFRHHELRHVICCDSDFAYIACKTLLYVNSYTSEALQGGGHLFPCSPEINGLVPLFPKNRKFIFCVPCSPILSLCPCSPKNFAFVPLK